MTELFVLSCGIFLFIFFRWAFKALPNENWQFVASMPKIKHADGTWTGRNFTFYGFFSATAYVLAVGMFIMLMSASGMSGLRTLLAIGIMLGICVPASKIVALIVERKKYTFTVAGASFVGLVTAPWLIWGLNQFKGIMPDGQELSAVHFLSAMSVSYAMGEGFGRLACISFGCCYGKPVSQCHPILRRFFANRAFTFRGKTKKAVYAGNLEGERVVPIQAITSTLYCSISLLGFYLHMKGFVYAALLSTLTVTQLWRLVSEFFRSDFRGTLKFSAYQIMAAITVPYAIAILFIFPAAGTATPDIITALKSLWHPEVMISLQVLWVAIFLYTGCSKVTGVSLSYHVIQDRL